MDLTLRSKSSSGDIPYNVYFKISSDGRLSVFCDCQAGEFGQFCKHKWQLLNGDEKMLVDSNQIDDLRLVHKLAIERGVGSLYNAVEQFEHEKKDADKAVKAKKVSVKKVIDKRGSLSELEYIEVTNTQFKAEQMVAYIKHRISQEKKAVAKKIKEGF